MTKCFCCAKNIENQDVILVCDTCKCYSHKDCMDIYAFHCEDYVLNDIKCPLCNKILEDHPIDKTNITKEMYTTKISKILNSITYGFDYETKLNLVKILLDLVLDSKDILLKKEEELSNAVKNKLIDLYYNEGWTKAEYYYKSLYNKPLP